MCAHIGDSRIYRLRGQAVQQLTFDHSLQWELRAAGQLPPGSDMASVVPKNVITRSLGPNSNVQLDLEGPHPALLVDVYMLCSDGLTGRVEDAELGTIMLCLPPKEAAQALVDLANLRGGPDNCTVVIAKIIGAEATTGGTPAEPLRLGASNETKPVHPAIWIVAAVLVLAALVIAMMGYLIPAGVALGGAAIAGIVGVAQRYRGIKAGTAVGHGRMLGKGPYTNTPCPPSHELAEKLAGTLQELREAAQEGSWSINWRPLDEAIKHAATADKAGNFAEAIRQYCRGITYMMSELKRQPPKKGSDSAISY
jgi:protein phosphatase